MKYLKPEENILTDLTALYENRGYKKYKPTAFEEYSLYLENRDFLISKNVITFSGAGGKLLALRPDVTLSIVNHSKADFTCCEKLFYNEKVYRQSQDSKEYKEISQTGVEIIGDVDQLCQTEIVILSIDTLATVSDKYILDISHMGFIEGLISSFGLRDEDKNLVYTYLKNKNIHDFEKFAVSLGLSKEQISAFKITTELGGNAKDAIKQAQKIALNDQMKNAVNELQSLINTLSQLGYTHCINLNFSIANNADYYNGLIFNGYIEGVPRSILSGGRYDKLLQKLGKNSAAIGFALYLGELERYFNSERKVVDYLVIYDDKTSFQALKFADEKIKNGKSVRLSSKVCDNLRFNEVINLTNGGNGND